MWPSMLNSLKTIYKEWKVCTSVYLCFKYEKKKKLLPVHTVTRQYLCYFDNSYIKMFSSSKRTDSFDSVTCVFFFIGVLVF